MTDSHHDRSRTIPGATPAATTSSPHIVVVDDDEPLAELIQECLADEGYAVTTCTRSNEAFGVIQAVSPALVLLDVRMEEVGGLGVLYQLTTDPRTRHIPVLLCTGVSADEMEVWDEVLAQKGVPILFKPFALADLEA